MQNPGMTNSFNFRMIYRSSPCSWGPVFDRRCNLVNRRFATTFTPTLRRVAEYYGVIDNPDLLRKMHSRPVAYLGGVAVFIGWVGGLAISQFLQLHYWDAAWNKMGLAHHVVVKPQIIVAAFIIIV